jgi:hypothetical protein
MNRHHNRYPVRGGDRSLRSGPPPTGPGNAFGKGFFGPGYTGGFWRAFRQAKVGGQVTVVMIAMLLWGLLGDPIWWQQMWSTGVYAPAHPGSAPDPKPPTDREVDADVLNQIGTTLYWVRRLGTADSVGPTCSPYADETSTAAADWKPLPSTAIQTRWDALNDTLAATFATCPAFDPKAVPSAPVPGWITALQDQVDTVGLIPAALPAS